MASRTRAYVAASTTGTILFLIVMATFALISIANYEAGKPTPSIPMVQCVKLTYRLTLSEQNSIMFCQGLGKSWFYRQTDSFKP